MDIFTNPFSRVSLVPADEYARFMAALTVLREAEGETRTGKLAVAEVIINRAIKRKLSLDQVCLQNATINGRTIYQFSCYSPADKRCDVYPMRNTNSWAVWQTCNDVIEQAITTPVEQQVSKGANLYYAPKSVVSVPAWATNGKAQQTAEIGNHRFYRE